MVLLFGLPAQADDSGLYFGFSTTNGTFYGLVIGEPNHFDQSEKQPGNYRYGFGEGGLHLGNGFGLKLASSGGIAFIGVKDSDKILSPLVGLDFGGQVNLNTNGSARSYYQWFPGLSLGLQTRVNDLQLSIMGKGGLGLGNFTSQGLAPSGALSAGGAAYLMYKGFGVGLDVVRFGGSTHVSGSVLGALGEARTSLSVTQMDGECQVTLMVGSF